MNTLLRWGVYATFLGFLMVGIGYLFGETFYFGLGWIVVGIGLPLSFVGLDLGQRAARAGTPASPMDGGPPLVARKAPKAKADFVCSDCGGDLTADMKVCPHCGAAIEGDEA